MSFVNLVKLKFFVILLYSCVFCVSNISSHQCSHDTIDYSTILPQNFFAQYSNNYPNQQFQSVNAQPIRVTYDFSLIPDQYQSIPSSFIQAQLENLVLYMQYFIKVVPRSSPIKNASQRLGCNNYTYPSSFITNGIQNSDFHLFITYIDSNFPNASPVQAWWCEVDPNPVAAVFQVNYSVIKFYYPSEYVTTNIFKSLIHQFIHVLGFSHTLFPFWIDNKSKLPYGNNISQLLSTYSFGNINSHIIQSFNLKYFVNNYYDCSNSEGMILENQPIVNNQVSHFEFDLVGNDLMTENTFLYLLSQLTQMTVFLLRDTGFYDTINENMLNVSENWWGKSETCEFIWKSCRSTAQNFLEFNKGADQACDFFQQGFSTPSIPTNSQCNMPQIEIVNLCQNSSQTPPDQINRMNTGVNSRCFKSNAYQTQGGSITTNVKCFKSTCDASFSTIQVTIWGTETVTCTYANEVIQLSKNGMGTSGQLTCPSNFKIFCSTFIIETCLRNCSNNGFCNKGICFCQNGFVGADCSAICPQNYVLDNNQCVQKCGSGKYQNPNNTCNVGCPQGFYADAVTQKCQICHPFCSACTGPSQQECQNCNFPYIYNAGASTCTDRKCDSSCATCFGLEANNCLKCFKGFYLDQNNTCQQCSPQCLECQSTKSQCTLCSNTPNVFYTYSQKYKTCISTCDKSCKTCTQPQSPTSCINCSQGFIRFGSNCVTTCDSSCLTCLQANSPNSCTSCNPGYFLNTQDSSCQKCQSPCLECSNSQSQCISCIPNYQLNSQTNVCELICDQACQKCLAPNDPTQCVQCSANYFSQQTAPPYTCTKCIYPCISCQQFGQCLNCDAGYNLIGNQCQMICHQSCQTCTQPNNSNACSSCSDKYFLQGSKCLECQSPCQNCVDSSTKCTSCIQNYQLQNNQCVSECDQSCLTCLQLNDKNSCLTCQTGFYFKQNSQVPVKGQCIQCSINCLKCDILQSSSQLQCLECQDGFQLNSLGECVKCDSTCKTCFLPNNPQACELCFPSYDLTSNHSCIQCQQGYYFSEQNQECLQCPMGCLSCSSNQICNSCVQGYTLDSNNNCTNTIKCHLTCKSCTNTSYQGCMACSSNRELKILNTEYQTGICDCPKETTDNGGEKCEFSNVQEIVAKTSQLSFSVSTSIISIASVINSNPIPFIMMMEFCQSVSYLSYVNYKPAMGLDSVLNSVSLINLSKVKIFNNIFGSDNESNKRLLDSPQEVQPSQSSPDDNSVKFQLNDKSTSFLENSFLIVVVNFIIWLLAGIFSLVKIKRYSNFLSKARRIFCISAPVVIFLLSSQEYSLLVFLQLKSPQYDTTQNIINLSFALASIVYIFVMSLYLTYQLQRNIKVKSAKKYYSDVENNKSIRNEQSSYKKGKTDQNHNSSSYGAPSRADFSNQKIVYQRPSQLDLAKNQSSYNETSEEKSVFSKFKTQSIQNNQIPYYKLRLYLIYKYVKQDNVMTRHFVQITVLRKLIISISCVVITENPIAQLSLQLFSYVVYCIYLLVAKPLKYPQQMLSMCIIDSIISILHIMYIIMVSYSDNEFLQKLMSLLILSTTISVFILFFVYSVFILVKLFYLQLMKCLYRNSIVKVKKDLKPIEELNIISNDKKDETIQHIIHQDNTDQIKSPTLIYNNSSKFISPKQSSRESITIKQ
ncbi:EGF-like domain protein (macronuclear) [Tetrahymena thermophila SB210]|uniref:EGF-like domain protein n=1 Tax=Tetrahymena thermophila (strain SB210) TaxID=312017 RepID=Q23G21_TETTS|nr:EGF-like domain protein [Tetrahymena thermophila SB210]EAR95439.2 EGF-like domain protein [Tetrahymena thermophila SB210]|eukprot:XP_001015684.2 EGF-like domain protein [Tetrahymena thermophila SB210]